MSEKTCRCGHDRGHKMVTAESDHSPLGYFRLMIGGTPVPRRVRFRCRTCGQVFDESTDYDVRRQYT
jgi:hypothetical protein